jgi:hypothetical protein
MSAAPGPSLPDPAPTPQAGPTSWPAAWQPLTPRGVGAFARATWRRLVFVQVLVAVLASGAFVWFLHAASLPALQKAIAELPDEGHIRDQILSTPISATTTLAAEPVLGFVVDLPRLGKPNLPSDFIVVFHQNDLEVCSPFGCLVFRYPRGWIIEFNRKELAPAVPAWLPFVLAAAGLAAVAILLLTWSLLATVFFLIPIIVARYSDRSLSFGASWKLTAAAFLPGTLLFAIGLVVYGLGWINLIQTTLLAAAYLMVSWFYLVLSPLALPRLGEATTVENPFLPPPAAIPPDRSATPERKKNPFASPPGTSSPEAPPTGSSEPWET